jgi:uncharacterized membrane protein YciS (DUF1049 family)
LTPREFKKTKFRSVGINIFQKLLLFPLSLYDLSTEFAIKITVGVALFRVVFGNIYVKYRETIVFRTQKETTQIFTIEKH